MLEFQSLLTNLVGFLLDSRFVVQRHLFLLQLEAQNLLFKLIYLLFLAIQFTQSVLPVFVCRVHNAASFRRWLTWILFLSVILFSSLFQSRNDFVILLLFHTSLPFLFIDLLGEELNLLQEDGVLLGLLMTAEMGTNACILPLSLTYDSNWRDKLRHRIVLSHMTLRLLSNFSIHFNFVFFCILFNFFGFFARLLAERTSAFLGHMIVILRFILLKNQWCIGLVVDLDTLQLVASITIQVAFRGIFCIFSGRIRR